MQQGLQNHGTFHFCLAKEFLTTSAPKGPKILKWYYDENRIFPIEAILKHKQVVHMRRKEPFTFFKYLFSFQRYSSF